MLGNFAVDLPHARLRERIRKTSEKAFARRGGFRALCGFGAG
jgi:hypothetical protein